MYQTRRPRFAHPRQYLRIFQLDLSYRALMRHLNVGMFTWEDKLEGAPVYADSFERQLRSVYLVKVKIEIANDGLSDNESDELDQPGRDLPARR